MAFTLTASADATAVGALSLNYWVRTGTTAPGLTYTGKVLAANPAAALTALTGEINYCTTTSKTWTVTDSTYSTGVENVVVGFDLVKKAQGTFSVSWGVIGTLWDFSTFTINLDFLDSANSAVKGKNLKCNMYKPGTNDFDFAFTTMDLSSLTAIAIAQETTTSHEVTSTKFDFRCNGAYAPVTAITTSNKIEVTMTTLGLAAVA